MEGRDRDRGEHFPQRFSRLLFWFLIALLFSTRLALALADYRSLISNNFYCDDAFYYLKIAENIAAGRGLTFDGVAPTNGFHPLYLLQLVPIFKWAGENRELPIHLSGIILTLWSTATGVLIFGLMRRLSSVPAALGALALFAVSPYFIIHGVNGLETGVALFFFVALITAYVAWIREGEGGTKQAVLFGVLGGMGVLARVDIVLLLAAVGADFVWRTIRRDSLLTRAYFTRTMAITTLTGLLIWLPWGLISKNLTGQFLPTSGKATKQIALNYGWSTLPAVWSGPVAADIFFDPDDVPPVFFADVGTRLATVFLFEWPVLAPLRINLPVTPFSDPGPSALSRAVQSSPRRALLLIVLPIGGGLAFALIRKRRPVRGGGLLVIFGIYLALITLGYTFYAPAYWFFGRYLVPAVLLATLVMIRWSDALRRSGGIKGKFAWPAILAVWIGCQLVSWNSFAEVDWSDSPETGFLANWRQFEPLIDESARIGAFQAGIFSYFSGRDVVNLDGKVNAGAQSALSRKRLHEYIRETGVSYIMDWEWVLVALCLRHMEKGDLAIRRIAEGATPADASLYAILPPTR